MKSIYNPKSLLQVDEFFDIQSSLFNNCPERALGNIFTRMIRNNGASARDRIKPNFVTTFGMPVENKAGLTEFVNDFGWLERWQMTHRSTGTGILISSLKCGFLPGVRFLGSGSPCSIQDSMILRATSSAISMVSAIVRPWAMRPCNTELVAKYWPSSMDSIEMGMRYSDMIFTSWAKYNIRAFEVKNWLCVEWENFR